MTPDRAFEIARKRIHRDVCDDGTIQISMHDSFGICFLLMTLTPNKEGTEDKNIVRGLADIIYHAANEPTEGDQT